MKRPTLVQVTTFLIKADHDKLKVVAAKIGVPVSILIRKLIAEGLNVVLGPPESDPEAAPAAPDSP